jgi:hypothetical protein
MTNSLFNTNQLTIPIFALGINLDLNPIVLSISVRVSQLSAPDNPRQPGVGPPRTPMLKGRS